MDPRGHVGPFLGPRPGLPFDHEIPGDPQPPGAQQHHDRRSHQDHAAQRAKQLGAVVSDQQQGQATDQQQAGEGGARDRRRPLAGPGHAQPDPGPTQQRLGQPPYGLLLVLGGVPPDQREAGHADGQRPGQVADPAGADHGGEDEHHDQQRPEGGGERDAPPVGHRPARDSAVLIRHRNEQPGQDVGRRTDAHQGGQHEDQPDDRDVHTGPRGQAGRHPAEETVLPAAPQRPTVPASARPQPGERAPRPALARSAFLQKHFHPSIIAPRDPHGYRGKP